MVEFVAKNIKRVARGVAAILVGLCASFSMIRVGAGFKLLMHGIDSQPTSSSAL
jgi:hypothetical protein